MSRANQYLIVFVLVDNAGHGANGSSWYAMSQDIKSLPGMDSPAIAGTHVERWTYPVLEDGTHGQPRKELG
jgi:hypothetical protein